MSTKSKVVVVVPTHKESPNSCEWVSLIQCCRVLEEHEIRLVCPQSLVTQAYTAKFPRLKIQRLPDKWFSSIEMYNKLKLSLWFYLQYVKFEYILTYELDAFVFRDDLLQWCESGYSYVGAPWFEGFCSPPPDAELVGVGNSGLSLRNVRHCIRALLKFSYIENPADRYNRLCTRNVKNKVMSRLYYWLKAYVFCNNTFFLFNRCDLSEDRFWSKQGGGDLDFVIPPPKVASKFSMEVNPRQLYEQNGHKLPFGCHAWWRYDLDFWKPFIEEFGYVVSSVKCNR